MSIQQVYAAIRVGRTPDAPQWDDLSKPMQELIEAIFNLEQIPFRLAHIQRH